MDHNYRYAGAHLKPKIAKAIILETFSGKTISRREIDATVIQYHELHGGLPSTAKTNPIKAALRYLKKKGFAENISKGSGSTWRIFEVPKPAPESANVQTLISAVRTEIQYLTVQIESFEQRKSELEADLSEYG